MLFNVPQFIDIEDKVVGPLTVKQFGWMAIGGVILLLLWTMLDTSAFIMAAVVVGIICSAFAFYRPYNQPLLSFLMSGVAFVTRPKVYVWGRISDNINKVNSNKTKMPIKAVEKKVISPDKISEISSLLDKPRG